MLDHFCFAHKYSGLVLRWTLERRVPLSAESGSFPERIQSFWSALRKSFIPRLLGMG